MARLLLCCDNRIYAYGGRFYFQSPDACDFFYRYLRVFERIRIVARCENEQRLGDSRVLIDDNRIEYSPLPLFHGPREYINVYKSIEKEIRSVVNDCDAAILRLPNPINDRILPRIISSKIPYAVEIVACARDIAKTDHSLMHRLIWRWEDFQIRKACYNADGVSCVTRHYLQQYYYSKKKDHFDSYYSSLSIEEDFFMGPKQLKEGHVFIISHVANQVYLNSIKGHKEMIDMLVYIKHRNDIKMRFVGASYYGGVEEIIRYAEEKGVRDMIEFTGFLDRIQLKRLYAETDLIIFPSRSEGLPRVIIEAMAAGIPCVGSPVGGIPELLPDRMLCDCFNPGALANKVNRLLGDASLYNEISDYSFKKSQEYKAQVLQLRRDNFYSKLKSLVKTN